MKPTSDDLIACLIDLVQDHEETAYGIFSHNNPWREAWKAEFPKWHAKVEHARKLLEAFDVRLAGPEPQPKAKRGPKLGPICRACGTHGGKRHKKGCPLSPSK